MSEKLMSQRNSNNEILQSSMSKRSENFPQWGNFSPRTHWVNSKHQSQVEVKFFPSGENFHLEHFMQTTNINLKWR